MRRWTEHLQVAWGTFALCVSLLLLGCADHASRTRGARTALDAQRPQEAIHLLNEELGVDTARQLPASLSGDQSLLVLDRAMVLHQVGEFALSSRDLEAADKAIDVLDMSRGGMHELGRYLFSDSTGPYRGPAYEKLMINTINLLNYLVRGDLGGARVEARRLAVMQDFIKNRENPGAAFSGPGSYLAGFAFEKSGRPQEALRYYDEALQAESYPSLREPVARLAAHATYRSPRIDQILQEEEALPPAPGIPPHPAAEGTSTPVDDADQAASDNPSDAAEPPLQPNPESAPAPEAFGEILAVVSYGRVPAKRAKRIPIGLALTYAANSMSAADRGHASRLAAQGLVTWVNYPELGRPRGEYGNPGFAINGTWQLMEQSIALDREARKAWEQAEGTVVASAITRMIARVVAGEAVRRAGKDSVWGILLGLGTQAALSAADTPDTRSWSTLPARMAFSRVRVAPGAYWIDLYARGIHKRQLVRVRPGGWAVVTLAALH